MVSQNLIPFKIYVTSFAVKLVVERKFLYTTATEHAFKTRALCPAVWKSHTIHANKQTILRNLRLLLILTETDDAPDTK